MRCMQCRSQIQVTVDTRAATTIITTAETMEDITIIRMEAMGVDTREEVETAVVVVREVVKL